MVRPSTPHQSQGTTLGMVSLPSRHWLARESPEPPTVPLVSGPNGMDRVLAVREGLRRASDWVPESQASGPAHQVEWSYPILEPPELFYKRGITAA